MKDIVVLLGESCAGKDRTLDALVNDFGYHRCVSYTTRPMRDGEIDKVHYNFVSDEEFENLWNNGKMFEKTSYNTDEGIWQYGIGTDSFISDNLNCVVLNPHGLNQVMSSKIKDRLFTVLLIADFKTRFFRYLDRDNITEKQKVELVNRIIRDEKDFSSFSGTDLVISSEKMSSEDIAHIINLELKTEFTQMK